MKSNHPTASIGRFLSENPSILLLCLIMACLTFTRCTNDNEKETRCAQRVLIDPGLFEAAQGDNVWIRTVEIDGDCLNIRFSFRPCNPDAIETRIHTGEVRGFIPAERDLLISVNGNDCSPNAQEVIMDMWVDISDLQVKNDDLILHFIQGGAEIRYEY